MSKANITPPYPTGEAAAVARKAALSPLAAGMGGSRILAIAAEVRTMLAQGHTVCNLTVGDFSPEHFKAPEVFRQNLVEEVQAGHTNYPPSDGTPELKQAIVDMYKRRLGIEFPIESVFIGSGARPPLFSAYASFLDPGDVLLYAAPSWNNHYYTYLNQAEAVVIQTRSEDGFMPTLEQIRPHLSTARLLHLNSPLNPTGTCIGQQQIREIAQAIVDENRRREAAGEKSLLMIYDMVYWMLTYGDTEHHDPIREVPEVAPYVVYVDAISKNLAATGLRVGWGMCPPYLQTAFKALVGHTGAWAPRPEQLATASFFNDDDALQAWLDSFRGALQARLDLIHSRFEAMAADGLPVEAIHPQGAIYLSVRVDLLGRTLANGSTIHSSEDIRSFLLQEAGVAVVPFEAFGLEDAQGWLRMSVGAVGMEELAAGLDRLEQAIRKALGK
ncbi:MAG: aminotransferase class I/II-fold pyridoxal phosphate-dependent enzyme [Myxococcota bacterium]|nr:aminotransferase class I/II-fold pyridoxal phosphate-dependent enzyme [Myxococcota bacterium]